MMVEGNELASKHSLFSDFGLITTIRSQSAQTPVFRTEIVIRHPQDDVRLIATVVQSMGRIGATSCISDLAKVLTDTSSELVKAQAVEALGWIGGEDARHVLERNLDYSRKTRDLTGYYFKALGRIGDKSSVRRMLLLYKENGQVGITDYPIPAFPGRELGKALAQIGTVAVTAILDFIEEVQAEKLHRLPLDILLGVLIELLDRASSEVSGKDLIRIVRLPELWGVACLGHTEGDLDVIDEIRTEPLDSSKLKDLARKEMNMTKG